MKIGKYFTLSELTTTNTGIENNPVRNEIDNLKLLVVNVLDPLRELYGKPIIVKSGYRSPLVNSKVGGANNSDHMKGMAADISAGSKRENKIIFEIIKNNFEWRQLINEYDFSWVHVSYNIKDNKKQILTIV